MTKYEIKDLYKDLPIVKRIFSIEKDRFNIGHSYIGMFNTFLTAAIIYGVYPWIPGWTFPFVIIGYIILGWTIGYLVMKYIVPIQNDINSRRLNPFFRDMSERLERIEEMVEDVHRRSKAKGKRDI